MSDNINFYNEGDIESNIAKVTTQTNYTPEQAREKLMLYNCDVVTVIKDYLGIKPVKKQLKSVNQETYKQLRSTLDSSMREYNEKHPIDLEQLANNINESEQNKLEKA